jgi:hypothetical protein
VLLQNGAGPVAECYGENEMVRRLTPPPWDKGPLRLACASACLFYAIPILSGVATSEPRNDMKARGCASPDMGDVLAMTFAVKVRSGHVPAPHLIYSFPAEHSQRWMR